ncbi:BaiN/RdsA family NAD(P)/FAD-dependent oxidoreductase [Arundinibacter roseus]|uniref:NAD(P)/FAD-dependent oxidoreductase n=1 Tax=Arundinibacter roseus TaxID=2070510 RepID=A0A4R4KA73_9BACT|nr:NAD(P)/FAD-dependent oxidoreductase [Arundinibacter roseus]TDB64463.1 NAD(P)/FAD-dependent oxidoreductase [Arundinibacter roseus]
MQIVIIGGGAAGFMAALTAAEFDPKAEILVLEKNRTVLNKVRISGGGRCNVTHACFDNRLIVKNYPRGEKLLRKLFKQFDAQSTIHWFEARGVVLKTEEDGRMFPVSNSSETIIECLQRQAQQAGIRIRTQVNVSNFTWIEDTFGNIRFRLQCGEEEFLEADRVIVATGGHPKTQGYEWLTQHNHEIELPVPSLFTFNAPNSYLLPLMGISVPDVLVKIPGTSLEWRGPLLLTHWGFSGPVILKLSAWGARILAEKNYHFTCRIHWLPAQSESQVREFLLSQKVNSPRQLVATQARFGFSSRLWRAFLQQAEISETIKWSELPQKNLNRLVDILTNSLFEIRGKSTFKEEFVTAGGIDLSELNPETMESKRVQGLFFAGEVIDVDGITGGFNFQNAWTTGFVAGKNCVVP